MGGKWRFEAQRRELSTVELWRRHTASGTVTAYTGLCRPWFRVRLTRPIHPLNGPGAQCRLALPRSQSRTSSARRSRSCQLTIEWPVSWHTLHGPSRRYECHPIHSRAYQRACPHVCRTCSTSIKTLRATPAARAGPRFTITHISTLIGMRRRHHGKMGETHPWACSETSTRLCRHRR